MANLLVEEMDPAGVPEKFKNPETGAIRLEALLGSYQELEKKMSTRSSAPKTPQDYNIACNHGLFEPDTEINSRLHARGFTQDQAQEVYDLAAERMMPMIRELVSDMRAEREVEKLVEHFGGEEKWEEVAKQLLNYGQRTLPADVLETLASSYDGVMSLNRMMQTGEPVLGVSASDAKDVSLNEKDLRSMMRDPKYWRDRDPSFIEKVTQGFQNIYMK